MNSTTKHISNKHSLWARHDVLIQWKFDEKATMRLMKGITTMMRIIWKYLLLTLCSRWDTFMNRLAFYGTCNGLEQHRSEAAGSEHKSVPWHTRTDL